MQRMHAIAMTAVVGALATAPSASAAQYRDSLAIPLGSRVRVIVTERPPGKLSGAFAGADSASVYVTERGTRESVAVPWTTIREIDLGRRLRSRTERFHRGARIGAVVTGTVSVIAIATAVVWDARGGCEGVDYCVPASLVIIPVSYVFTVAGTALGGTLALPFAYRWKRVWPHRRSAG